MKWMDGSCYKGEFQNGAMSGEGKLKRLGKKPIQGIFENNKLIRPMNAD